MRAKVSVIVVSGFFGAGKTTLLRRLVSELDPVRTAVITNDLSRCGAEADSFEAAHYLRGEALIELTAGCSRCSLREQLVDTITRLARSGRFDTILIESSGSTDPLVAANAFDSVDAEGRALAAVARLDHLVTVVDAERFWGDYESGDHLRQRGLGTGVDDERTIAELLADQVECSTALVLNKCDRVTQPERQRLEQFLRRVNPDALVVSTCHGMVEPSILEPSYPRGENAHELKPGWMHLLSRGPLPDEQSQDDATYVYRARRPFHPFRFWMLMQDEWPGVLRSKGYFWIASQTTTCYMWSQAGANCLYERLGRWWAAIPDQHWPKGESALQELRKVWDLEYGDRRIEIAFIGEQVDRVDLKRRLDICLLTRDELCLDEELWRALRDPFKRPSWEKRHTRSERGEPLH
jgi:G3E family GTPase